MSTAIATPPVTALPMSVTPPPKRSVQAPVATPVPPQQLDHTPPENVRLPGFTDAVALRRFTAKEFDRLVELDIINEQDPVELINGYMVHKMSRGTSHDLSITRLNKWFYRTISDEFTVRSQCGASFIDDRPEPDLAVARGADREYKSHHPGVGDILLAVEVADSSLTLDRVNKTKMYASVGIPEYWIINIPERQIEVYTDPTGAGDLAAYRNRKDYLEADSVPLVLDGTAIGSLPVIDLLP